MNPRRRFRDLFNEGISSVARRQLITMGQVEQRIAELTGYSHHTVQYWRRGNIPAQQEIVEQLVDYCITNGRLDRDWVRSFLTQAGCSDLVGSSTSRLFPEGKDHRPYVFMCYQRDQEPDVSLALQLSQELTWRGYDVFFEQARTIDADWVERVHSELEHAEYFVVLLSGHSVRNEVVLLELEAAHQLRGGPTGGPRILPVRLGYHEPFRDPLSTYLEKVDWSVWEQDNDTKRLVEELERAMSGTTLPSTDQAMPDLARNNEMGTLLPPMPSPELEIPSGTVDLQSDFYIAREEDQVALSAIVNSGVTITIKGPRQVGKSSLLIRVAHAASKLGKRVAFLDFQLMCSALKDSDTFFKQFCTLLTYQLGLENQVDAYWREPLSNTQLCTNYVGNHVMRYLDQPLVLAIDEADSIFATDFSTDFFAMLRHWHNQRAFSPDWKNLDLVLVTSTEPYYFIDNLIQSPFNVGQVVELQDFTLEQVADLNRRHGCPLSPDEEQQLMTLLNGHPYLVRQALYLVASHRVTPHGLFTQATSDRGPFSDHLRSLLMRLHTREHLIQALRQVERHHQCPDPDVYFRLRGAGLVRQDGTTVLFRSQLYTDFFRGYLNHSGQYGSSKQRGKLDVALRPTLRRLLPRLLPKYRDD